MTYFPFPFSASLAAFLARLSTTADCDIKASGHSFSITRLNNLASSIVIRTITGTVLFPAMSEYPRCLKSWQENYSFQVKLKITGIVEMVDITLQTATNGPSAARKSLDGVYASALKSILLHPPTGPALRSHKSVLSRSPLNNVSIVPGCTNLLHSPQRRPPRHRFTRSFPSLPARVRTLALLRPQLHREIQHQYGTHLCRAETLPLHTRKQGRHRIRKWEMATSRMGKVHFEDGPRRSQYPLGAWQWGSRSSLSSAPRKFRLTQSDKNRETVRQQLIRLPARFAS